jgi:hypothetical protein
LVILSSLRLSQSWGLKRGIWYNFIAIARIKLAKFGISRDFPLWACFLNLIRRVLSCLPFSISISKFDDSDRLPTTVGSALLCQAVKMSTFGGVMEEFPNVRGVFDHYMSKGIGSWSYAVDFFRPIRPKAGETPLPPALACFLSHVHTDHLEGLETLSFKGPLYVLFESWRWFLAHHVASIYCSAATRELLLRLEKYPHRLNFVKGILEARRVVFKHLEKLLVWTDLFQRCSSAADP